MKNSHTQIAILSVFPFSEGWNYIPWWLN